MDVQITEAPPERSRIDRGVRLLLARYNVTRTPREIAWEELRELAEEEGLFIDPRDDQPAPARDFSNLGLSR
jgi:hypothetical protein